MQRLLTTLATLLCLSAAPLMVSLAADAQPIWVGYVDFFPVSYLKDGKADGAGIELTRKVIAGLPIILDEQPIQIRRLLTEMKSEPMLAVALVRSDDREKDYHWLAELYRDQLVVVTLRGGRQAASLEEARTLSTIGLIKGAAADRFTQAHGFFNIQPILDMASAAQMLKTHRVEGWCGLRGSISASWRLAGYDLSDLQFSPAFEEEPVWMAASKTVPNSVLGLFHRRLVAAEQDGTMERLFGELRRAK